MRIYFSTVIRSAAPLEGGELVCLDWERKRVLARTVIAPTRPRLDDPNRLGNTRGCRGIALVGEEVIVCSYHTLRVFDRELNPLRDLTHPLMVSLHEVWTDGGPDIWASSTAIDAALCFDLQDGRLLDARWPRESSYFQERLGITPLAIDKEADNRGLFMGSAHTRHEHHLHLNAVAVWRGQLLALFSKFGLVVNLDEPAILISDRRLKGAHNLIVDPRGFAWVSDTLGRGVLHFDLRSGEPPRKLGFGEAPEVRALVRGHDRVYALKRILARFRLHPHAPPRPAFARGLARHGGSLFVGISPATILQLDETTGALIDLYTDSHDVAACIHGLEVAQS